MAQRGPGLKVQAAHAIAENAATDRQLAVVINKAGNDDRVEVPVSLLLALRSRLDSNSQLIQKQDRKIDELNNQLFTA